MHHCVLYTVAANFYQGVVVFSYFGLCTDPPPLRENPEGGGRGVCAPATGNSVLLIRP